MSDAEVVLPKVPRESPYYPVIMPVSVALVNKYGEPKLDSDEGFEKFLLGVQYTGAKIAEVV